MARVSFRMLLTDEERRALLRGGYMTEDAGGSFTLTDLGRARYGHLRQLTDKQVVIDDGAQYLLAPEMTNGPRRLRPIR